MRTETIRVGEEPEKHPSIKFECLDQSLKVREIMDKDLSRYRESGIFRYDVGEDDEFARTVGVRFDVRDLREINEPRYVWFKRGEDGPILVIAANDAKGIQNFPESARVVPEGSNYSEIGLQIYDRQPNSYSAKIRAC